MSDRADQPTLLQRISRRARGRYLRLALVKVRSINACSFILAAVVGLYSIPDAVYGQELLSLSRQDGKTVPALAYPVESKGCRGIAVISHGAGGSEKGYAYLAEFMSSQGYYAVVPGHQESGRQALKQYAQHGGLREGLTKLITDPAAYQGRLMDISAAKQWAETQCNARRSILLGHSMGAATVMIEAGARNKLGVKGANRFDIYVALSPQGVGAIFPPGAWEGIDKPVLTMTGTRDKELGGKSWESRTEPFSDMPPGCKWLGVIDRATHKHFSGRGFSSRTEQLTTKTILSFIQSVDRGDCAAPPDMRGINIDTK